MDLKDAIDRLADALGYGGHLLSCVDPVAFINAATEKIISLKTELSEVKKSVNFIQANDPHPEPPKITFICLECEKLKAKLSMLKQAVKDLNPKHQLGRDELLIEPIDWLKLWEMVKDN